MSTRDEIVRLGDELIRERGFNDFSFHDIAQELGLKNASVHYYFSTKTDLGIAVIKHHSARLIEFETAHAHLSPSEKLIAFLKVYTSVKADNRICIVGSLATDMVSLKPVMARQLKFFAQQVISFLTQLLEEGRKSGEFRYSQSPRTKALMIITNLLASLQLARLLEDQDFQTIQTTILKEVKA